MASSSAATRPSRKPRVGYVFDNYMHQRSIIGLADGFEYREVHDLNKALLAGNRLARYRIPSPPYPDETDLRFSFRDFGLNRVDLLHFFNSVSYGRTPWVTTFVTVTPRFRRTLDLHHGPDCGYASLVGNEKVEKALEALAGDACRRVIAMSECALAMQRELLSEFPDLGAAIEPKLTTLHPPQDPLVPGPARSGPDEPIRFMFVGRAFFRKGGPEILEAFVEARQSMPDIRLIVVSSLDVDAPAAGPSLMRSASRDGWEAEVEAARNVLRENDEWIEYYPSLPNRDVLELMKSSHVGLLPTQADTYGYSLLEFQAAGLPVISTDIRALPETNDDQVGWLIRVPKNRLGEALYTTADDRRVLRETVRSGLVATIEDIAGDRESITRKGEAALERLCRNHSSAEYSRRLGAIYEEALAG